MDEKSLWTIKLHNWNLHVLILFETNCYKYSVVHDFIYLEEVLFRLILNNE